MTTLLDKKQSVIGKVQDLDEATPDQVLCRIAALAPMVARHAGDFEQGRRLPGGARVRSQVGTDLRLLRPRRYGGLELDAPSAFPAIAALGPFGVSFAP